jgi:hypothetical protein
MEHNQNIDALRAAFGLTGREAALADAMLGGVSEAEALRLAAGVGGPGAMRKHMTGIRRKLPRGGVISRRLPTHYWLSESAVECCLEALGAGSESARFCHEPHEPHEQAAGLTGRSGSCMGAPSAQFMELATPERARPRPRPGSVRVVRVVRDKTLAAPDAVTAFPEVPR